MYVGSLGAAKASVKQSPENRDKNVVLGWVGNSDGRELITGAHTVLPARVLYRKHAKARCSEGQNGGGHQGSPTLGRR